MTTEIEKTFFDTFGIEKVTTYSCYEYYTYERGIDIWGEHCEKYLKDGGECDNCDKKAFIQEYPQITDRILLELIRIIGKKPFGYLQCENTYSTNLGDTRDMITVEADSLKEGLLTLAMQNKVVLRIKHQVRTLFEEEK